MFSCKYCKNFKNTYFQEHLRTAAAKIIDSAPLSKITVVLVELLLRYLAYFPTRVPDTSDTSATQVRHEQHECDTSDTRVTRVQQECDKSDIISIPV